MRQKAVDYWLADHLQGKNSLMISPDNAEAAALARAARGRLAELGVVDRAAVLAMKLDGNDAGIGDLVQARQNVNDLDTGDGSLANRDVLRIEGKDGARVSVSKLMASGEWTPKFDVGAAYLEEHGQLAYAGNVHTAQGRTVDRGFLVSDGHMTRKALYPAITRGAESNVMLWVTSEAGKGSLDDNAPADQPRTTAEALFTTALANEREQTTALETRHQGKDDVASTGHLLGLWMEITREAAGKEYDLAAREALPQQDYERYMTDPERGTLHQRLHAAELQGQDSRAILEQALTSRDMAGAGSVAAVLHSRVNREALSSPTTQQGTWAQRTRELADPEMHEAAQALAQALDSRAQDLGERAASMQPVWALKHIGPLPQDEQDRQAWIERGWHGRSSQGTDRAS